MLLYDEDQQVLFVGDPKHAYSKSKMADYRRFGKQ